ncbi:MAG: 16S rRNA (cytidine(1402)-2'-O)-methyltransferase [Gammaproteobacteria bacterium]
MSESEKVMSEMPSRPAHLDGVDDAELDGPSVMESLNPSTLYVVATPIGHLGDMSFRAVAVLRKADAILAEDTRHSKKLFAHYGIKPRGLFAMHQHNESSIAERWLERISRGESVALISDAGTPLVSDPGYALVKCCVDAGVTVCVVPGPCAFVAAMSVSGLPCHDFRFVGFLPNKSAARREQLAQYIDAPSTIGFYEAPHRLEATVADMLSVFGATRQCVLAHDLTKRFESYVRGDLEACARAVTLAKPRGEWVILVAPTLRTPPALTEAWPDGVSQLLVALKEHLPPKTASAIVADHYGVSKKACYQWLVNQ